MPKPRHNKGCDLFGSVIAANLSLYMIQNMASLWFLFSLAKQAFGYIALVSNFWFGNIYVFTSYKKIIKQNIQTCLQITSPALDKLYDFIWYQIKL